MKKRNKYRIRRIFLFGIILLTLVVGMNLAKDFMGYSFKPEKVYTESMKSPVELMDTGNMNLYSKSAIVMDLDTKEVLLEKNRGERIYPASMTKVMTALLAVEDLNPSSRLKIESETMDQMMKEGASLAGFSTGELVTVEDLIYGTLLPSGGEASITLANAISGSEKEFAVAMNEKAQSIGMMNTNFRNSTGLHSEKHYTTVEDMAILLEYALKNEKFEKYFTSFEHVTENNLLLTSTIIKKEDTTTENGQILGGKTGYTSKAGLTLSSLVEVNGRKYIIVVGNADGSPYTEQFNIMDVKTIMENL